MNDISVKRYSLTRTDTQNIIRKLINKKSLRRIKRYGVYELKGSSSDSDVARTLECEVFNQYFGNDAHLMSREYGEYEDFSDFIVVIDQKKLLAVGVVRLVSHSNKSLKTLVDTTSDASPWKLTHKKIQELHDLNYDKTWDIATIAVKRHYRNKTARRLIRSLLLHSIHNHALSNDAEHWIALLDDIHLNTFRELGIPVESLAGSSSKPYLGSNATTPIIVNVHDVASGIKKKSRITHRLLIKGRFLRRFASF